MQTTDMEQIEISIEEAKKLVRMGDDLRKLTSNREFKRVILDGYFKEEAQRLVSISADHALREHQPQIAESIRAISLFQQFLQMVDRTGNMARQQIEDLEGERDLLESEA